ncbi:hypothetical protein ACYCFL_17560 [Stutzerimonas nitrititolerans]|uniref:Uncharacterized protein n=2 Tax=Stutzerimonas nitrititolerans TaxID=2482751 RepID=A0ABX9V861_9GAMM|nr:hypothetical protein [Stutzerimonas nitrititolerans]MBT1121250.1 hypothetical protein [Stutzerimonas nitrititolerans]RMI01640.1 hypothetical protein EA795_08825 [Stutzerimonas nitrititolerans]
MNFHVWFETWPLDLQIACLLSPFVISFFGMAIGVYIACSRHFEVMLAAFSSSAWAQQSRILGTTSLASRCYLVSSLSGALIFPQYLVRKGVLNADDVRNFPPALRRLMVISAWLVCLGMAWLFLFMALLKLSGVE